MAGDVGRERCHPQSRPLPSALARPDNIVYMVLCNYKVYVYKASCFCETVYFVNKDIATLRLVSPKVSCAEGHWLSPFTSPGSGSGKADSVLAFGTMKRIMTRGPLVWLTPRPRVHLLERLPCSQSHWLCSGGVPTPE